MKATVLNVQRMSTEDGPGIRTTVFFKGCSLACDWCQNPESLDRRPEVVWQEWRCIGGRACGAAGRQAAIELDTAGSRTNADVCTACGACADDCPAAARELLGTPWELDALVAHLAKDRAWFGDDGGVTCSGGEPGLQADFLEALLARLRALGIHTALDTCGLVGRKELLALADAADLVLYDLKLLDDARHRRHTDRGNGRILDNLRALGERMRAGGGPRALWVRTPLIPGVTATRDNVAAIGGFLTEALDGLVERWELCAFNDLCGKQYERLGRTWPYAETPLLTAAELEALAEVARGVGVDPARVVAGGPTRVEA